MRIHSQCEYQGEYAPIGALVELRGAKLTDKYRTTIRGHMSTLVSRAKRRATDKNIPFNIDLDYVLTLPHEHCPALGIPLEWCAGALHRTDSAPSLDRIIPSLGYVRGNVAWISWRANRIKNDSTPNELTMIANWLSEHYTNAPKWGAM